MKNIKFDQLKMLIKETANESDFESLRKIATNYDYILSELDAVKFNYIAYCEKVFRPGSTFQFRTGTGRLITYKVVECTKPDERMLYSPYYVVYGDSEQDGPITILLDPETLDKLDV